MSPLIEGMGIGAATLFFVILLLKLTGFRKPEGLSESSRGHKPPDCSGLVIQPRSGAGEGGIGGRSRALSGAPSGLVAIKHYLPGAYALVVPHIFRTYARVVSCVLISLLAIAFGWHQAGVPDAAERAPPETVGPLALDSIQYDEGLDFCESFPA